MCDYVVNHKHDVHDGYRLDPYSKDDPIIPLKWVISCVFLDYQRMATGTRRKRREDGSPAKERMKQTPRKDQILQLLQVIICLVYTKAKKNRKLINGTSNQ